jgi:hypothetical protein
LSDILRGSDQPAGCNLPLHRKLRPDRRSYIILHMKSLVKGYSPIFPEFFLLGAGGNLVPVIFDKTVNLSLFFRNKVMIFLFMRASLFVGVQVGAVKSGENKNDMIIVPNNRMPGAGLRRAGGLGARASKPDPSHTKEVPAGSVFFRTIGGFLKVCGHSKRPWPLLWRHC